AVVQIVAHTQRLRALAQQRHQEPERFREDAEVVPLARAFPGREAIRSRLRIGRDEARGQRDRGAPQAREALELGLELRRALRALADGGDPRGETVARARPGPSSPPSRSLASSSCLMPSTIASCWARVSAAPPGR